MCIRNRLDTDLGKFCARHTHGKRNRVHGPSLHGAVKELTQMCIRDRIKPKSKGNPHGEMLCGFRPYPRVTGGHLYAGSANLYARRIQPRYSPADVAMRILPYGYGWIRPELRANCGSASCKNWKALKFKEKWVFFVDFERKMVK